MIRFIRLLFYHIYLYFYKVDDGNKALAKFTTWLIFTLLFGVIIYSMYVFIRLHSDNAVVHTFYIYYILVFIIIGFFVGRNIYIIGFESLDSFRNYNIKYYFYFFLIVGFTFAVAFYSTNVNQKRIFEKKKIENHGKAG
ncbi:hypothetical protein EGY05_02100 [Chryseobacterium arthrosphaerae]|uniref:Uncharacterized protein n=1 Tax=Chryseobacterium arthrosphaerae TaxID=651561 RepID=A0A1B8ZEW6_9FLAO|nr:hypothetical protein EGY05_02100 [Chryseobacterium arthrosphaerae]OCA70145.1 hypothetical protein BBI00_20090 [Chryseobacterium arthrosphaerae]